MPGDMMPPSRRDLDGGALLNVAPSGSEGQSCLFLDSAGLAAAIAAADFSDCAATVVGYGNMGREYVKALRVLGVRRIRVCSRSAGPLEELREVAGVETVSGGWERLECRPEPGEVALVATPTLDLIGPAERLAALGFRRLLIEKPVSLWSHKITPLAELLERQGIEAICAYNRIAYPSFHEAVARAAGEGGITSCAYTFTEIIRPDWPERFPQEELARWGISNSLHVIGMAHGLIGMPGTWSGYQRGALAWHPTGAVFVGSGVSEHGIPFSYQADWGSKGRWSVEIHTALSSYRFCPLEQLVRKTSPRSDWEEITLATFAPQVKVGFVEQVAAMLSPELRKSLPLVSLWEAAALTRYGEEVFGYAGLEARR